MASIAFLISMAFVATLAPALAVDYMVGDDSGWKLNFDYSKWAEGKDFRVGDTIAFMYTPGVHNVLKVSGPDFQRCTSTNATSVPLMTGNDVIRLSSAGKKWYICDIAEHCSKGMKLVITVAEAAEGPAPAPSPGTSAGVEVSPFKSCAWILVAMAVYRMIMA